jgi:hypothetical protein
MKHTHIVVDGCYDHCSDHHEPIGHGNVNLSMEVFRCVINSDLWEI